MRNLTALTALFALVATGCGGAAKKPGGSGGSAGGGPRHGQNCSALVTSDLGRGGWISPVRSVPLAHAQGSNFRCATVFLDGSGQLILELIVAPGDTTTLNASRREALAQFGRRSVRSLPALGAGAFVARRELSFLRSGRLVTLQTGYSRQGRLQLTVDQLTRLARIAAAGV